MPIFAKKVLIQPGEAHVFKLEAGQSCRVTDTAGSQVADFIGISLDGDEWISPPETLNFYWSFRVLPGQYFYTSSRRPGLKLTRDDSNGVHDLTNAPCSRELYESMGIEDHLNCRDAFDQAFREVGLSEWNKATPINFFQNTQRAANGEFLDSPAGTKPGTSVEVTAELDMWVGVSACPCDVAKYGTPISGEEPGPIELAFN